MSKTSHIPRVEIAPGYSISSIINGCWQLAAGHGGNQTTEAEVFNRFAELVDAGFTSFDCADIYTGVEALLGRFIRRLDAKDRIQVHTKFVPDLDSLESLDRAAVEAVIDRSLRRLGVERLDLVQFHWWDYAVPGYMEALDTLARLRKAGKIRLLGLTNFDCPHVKEILAGGISVATLQLQYSLLDRRPEKGMVELCQSHRVSLLTYGVLCGGLLSGRYLGQSSARARNRSLQKYMLMVKEAGGWNVLQRLLATLAAISEQHGDSLSAAAAQWVLDRPGVSALILGTGPSSHVTENQRLVNLDLTAVNMKDIGTVLAEIPVPAGDVYGLERERGGPHAEIMNMNLSQPDNTTGTVA